MSVLVVKKAETRKELNASYRLRYEIYVGKLGWLANNYSFRSEQDEYDSPERSSTFIAYRDGLPVKSGIIGMVRAIYPTKDLPLPIYRDFPECYFPPKAEKSCEISRLICSDVFKALNMEERSMYARHSISLALIRALYRETWYEKNITHWFASLDVVVLGLIRFLGFPFEEIGEPKYYMGSLTAPVVLPRDKANAAFLENPPLYEYLNGDVIEEEVVEEANAVLNSSL
ncbi:MAG: hypothetical protein PHI88_00515 [Candidatus Pacebacteria bacterium]|nr:hypothetical protein [Candidatus Paceibacterota bacterium]